MRHLLPLLALFAVPSFGAKPNVVVIMADDIGLEAYTPYGGESYRTPTAERLAREGVRFTHCYSQPVCTPSRNKIMTGRANRRNYVSFGLLKPTETTFAHVLKEAGYATAVAGKWQLTGGAGENRDKGTTPGGAGFDEHCLWAYEHDLTSAQFERYQKESGIRGKTSRFWAPAVLRNGEYVPTSRDLYGPDVYNEFALDFIERNRDRPFFAYVLHSMPHIPLYASEDFEGTSPRGLYGDVIEEIDWSVGEIRAALDDAYPPGT